MIRLAFVGLGEGIGNVLLGVPVVDALLGAGFDVELDLRATPPGVRLDLAEVILRGRTGVSFLGERPCAPEYDLAVLSSWWASFGGPFPRATETRVGAPAVEHEPEVLSNLAAMRGIVEGPSACVRVARSGLWPMVEDWKSLGRPIVALHPGCKPDHAWRARKVYPRWYEVVHRLKEAGACVVVVGSKADADLYVGEPNLDVRARPKSLAWTADLLACCDVVLSGDSGVHHLAVALGLPTVAVFGDSSDVKARHPEPCGPEPVVLGPFREPHGFAAVSPRTIARACMIAAAARERASA